MLKLLEILLHIIKYMQKYTEFHVIWNCFPNSGHNYSYKSLAGEWIDSTSK